MGNVLAWAAAAVAFCWPIACAEDSTVPPYNAGNDPPGTLDLIPSLMLEGGQATIIRMEYHFWDPDGDVLSYSATSSNPDVVSVEASDYAISVTGRMRGTATVTVVATDPGGLTAQQNFDVTVSNGRPLAADSIPHQVLVETDTTEVILSPYFIDPDGDLLAYAATVSSTGVATVTVTGDTLKIAPVAKGLALLTVRASDPEGLSAELLFDAAVPNQPPASLDPISGRWLIPGNSGVLDASVHFSDPEEEVLDYAATSSNSGVASMSVSGSIVKIVAVGIGTTSVAITATDADGLRAQQTLEVTVERNLDRPALVALYEATNGPEWIRADNWSSSAPLGDWYGVATDEAGRVVELNLKSNKLVGPIPPQVGNLQHLSALNLAFNYLTGSIPAEVGSLASLETLRLDLNSLAGSIPAELGRLQGLTNLNLSLNTLTGPIPRELGKLGQLTALDLRWNDLSGRIPPELGNLIHLLSLRLNNNGLSGPIPSRIGDLSSLGILELSHNGLAGSIPSELGGLSSLFTLALDANALAGPIPSVIGSIVRLRTLKLQDNHLTGVIPPQLGNLGALRQLRLSGNDLDGPIPSQIGSLSDLRVLAVNDNRLTGPIAPSLLELEELTEFAFQTNNGVCIPGTPRFVRWTGGITRLGGSFCNESNIATLKALYEATRGPDWKNRSGWLSDSAPGGWHGITTDSMGRVVSLNLSDNGLSGWIPSELGHLDELEELRLDGNALTGVLPLSLSTLSLRELHYDDTELCAPANSSFRQWLGTIEFVSGTGTECELTDRDILVAFYQATDGASWKTDTNWLTDAPLDEWYGVEANTAGQVTGIRFVRNNVVGPLLPELGSLTQLSSLDLYLNGLKGPLPPQLGNLSKLETLILSSNQLTGSVPPELGDLSNLSILALSGNRLAGPIPVDLLRLARLQYLWLNRNQLTGTIPPGLGELPELLGIRLNENRLSGAVPSSLSNLSGLEHLALAHNRLSGSVPTEFVSLRHLTRLELEDNPEMSGALPDSMTALPIDTLYLAGTDICIPRKHGFVEWVEQMQESRVAYCPPDRGAYAYLTQGIQSFARPVPLVAGDPALLRVFVTASGATGESIPPIRARFYLAGRETHVVDIPDGNQPLPDQVEEGRLDASANVRIPSRVVRPGLEMVVEIDPEGTLDPMVDVAKRIPEDGRIALDVRALPKMDLTLVPLVWNASSDSAILELTSDLDAEHDLFWETRNLLPVGEFEFHLHKPVLTAPPGSERLLREIEAIRVLEGGLGYYWGTWVGFGLTSGRSDFLGFTSIGPLNSWAVAHQLGHNMGLGRAPCGLDRLYTDRYFPQTDGSIGDWGYDFRGNGNLVEPGTYDFMSYCSPRWISQYHFVQALRFREERENRQAPVAVAPTRTILVWGGVDAEGTPYLEPSFVVDAPPFLPRSRGPYKLTGQSDSGTELFLLSFDMTTVAEEAATSGFAFAIPVEPNWPGALDRIVLSGPGGSVTLGREGDSPAALLRDPETGQIRGILRESSPGSLATTLEAVLRDQPNLQLLVSRGIPDIVDWLR